jgi:hypothetical protein
MPRDACNVATESRRMHAFVLGAPNPPPVPTSTCTMPSEACGVLRAAVTATAVPSKVRLVNAAQRAVGRPRLVRASLLDLCMVSCGPTIAREVQIALHADERPRHATVSNGTMS